MYHFQTFLIPMSLTIQQALNKIQSLIAAAIQKDGGAGKRNVIRSSEPILNIHDAVKSELQNQGIAADRIIPSFGHRNPEMKLSGALKQKNQDVCVVPDGLGHQLETLIGGFLDGNADVYGKEFTEKTMAINVRSQLSSIQKNFDTLFERTMFEAANLHERCPKMCLGEVYMIAAPEFDDQADDSNAVGFKTPNKSLVEKYLKSFNSINNRTDTGKDFYKYERVCLLIVDFTQNPPKLYNSTAELKNAGLLSQDSTASIDSLTWDNFIKSLLEVYRERFESNEVEEKL